MVQYIVILGAILDLLGGIPYLRDTLSGRSKPNRVTFLMWGIAPCIDTAAAFSAGARWSVLPVLSAGLVPLAILVASFFNKKALWKLHWHDYVCGVISLAALILWKETHQPTIAIILAIVSDIFASLPTIKKSWTHPETETPLSYAIAAVAVSTSFFAIPMWKFSEYAFPAYLVLNGLMIFMIISYRRKNAASIIS